MTRDRWLDEGLEVLREEGAAGLKIDRLAARVGLSKGSFFHHFASAAVYRSAVLDRWRAQALGDLRAAPPREVLPQLADRIGDLLDVRLEGAVRAWAFEDPEAAAAVESIDQARLSALEMVWSQLIADPGRARAAALLPHLAVIGASVALPPLSRADLESAFALLAELVPVVSDSGTDPGLDGSPGN